MKRFFSGIITALFLMFIVSIVSANKTQCDGNHEPIIIRDTIYVTSFLDKGPREGLIEALEYMGIEDKERIYCQAVLETANFTSGGCTRDNNLFGLYNSKEQEFYTYTHWFQSVIDYKYKIAYKKYNGEDHYDFLTRIGYAEDPDYISKLKIIEKQIFSTQQKYFLYAGYSLYQGLI
jgi:hypothetical protein